MRIYLTSILLASSIAAFAQSNIKESSNAFALYSKTGDIKNLENAKKFIDAAYKTKRDSSNTRYNVQRAMVYSSLAYADADRKIKTPQDPIYITYDALKRLRPRDLENFTGEIKYVNQNLAAAHIFKANQALDKNEYQVAYDNFRQVLELGVVNQEVLYNLALLASQTKDYSQAVVFYKELIKNDFATAENYLELAQVYEQQQLSQEALNSLQEARLKFPEDKAVLMSLIQKLSSIASYSSIIPLIDEALKHEPENHELYYLAGYANESEGNISAAKKYYEQLIRLDDNNYEANLALGLIHLDDFLKHPDNTEAQYHAQNLLLKANEIKPYDINALQSLAVYYEKAVNPTQLDRVKLLLNQLSNN